MYQAVPSAFRPRVLPHNEANTTIVMNDRAETPSRDEHDRHPPHARLADPYPRPGEVLAQPVIVLREPTQLELGHGLLVRPRGFHGG